VAARTLLALVSGVVLSLGFEPVALPWLLPVALAAFFGCLVGRTPRQGLLIGLAFGVGFLFVHLFWMRVVAWAGWIALAGVLALFHAVYGALAAHATRYRWWPLALPVGWVALEWARSGWPLSGMPWGRLSFGVIDTPLAPALPYLGTTGVSLVVALLGSLLACTVLERGRRYAGAAALAGVCLLMTLPVLRPWEPAPTGELTAAVVQGDVPGEGDDLIPVHREVTSNHVEATVRIGDEVATGERERPAFVVWPENSTAVDPVLDISTRVGIQRAADVVGVPVLVGAMVDGPAPKQIYNRGIVWHPESGPGETYTKHHLVPFGEYLPWRSRLEGWNLGRLHEIHSDQLPGTGYEPLTIGGYRVADAICFDVAYDDVLHGQVARGAEVVTVQTSNATFIKTRQVDQQYAITRVRALELGRSVLVASTNGLTGIIGPDGETRQLAERRTTAVLQDTVPTVTAITPAVRMGPWPPRVCALAALSYLLVNLGFRSSAYLRRRPTDRAEEIPAPAEPSEASHP